MTGNVCTYVFFPGTDVGLNWNPAALSLGVDAQAGLEGMQEEAFSITVTGEQAARMWWMVAYGPKFLPRMTDRVRQSIRMVYGKGSPHAE